jgi:hypothetical protein
MDSSVYIMYRWTVSCMKLNAFLKRIISEHYIE